jgi:hypothetical protein
MKYQQKFGDEIEKCEICQFCHKLSVREKSLINCIFAVYNFHLYFNILYILNFKIAFNLIATQYLNHLYV